MISVRGALEQRAPLAILTAAFLFNLGQGVLRHSMPLYLEQSFAANYRMVTMIPVVFGAGKWLANLPAGYVLGRRGRSLMIGGLLLIASIDVMSVRTARYDVFLGLRALGGVGWAMFATVATTAMIKLPAAQRRGRAVSLLLMSETAGLLLGSATGGWLYQGVGVASPFLFEAACMIVAAVAVARWASLPAERATAPRRSGDRRLLGSVLRTPGVLLMGAIDAVLTAIQTGVLVFLFPLYLLERGSIGPEAVGLLVSLSVLGRLSLFTHPVVLGVFSFSIGAAAGFVAAVPTALMSDQVPRPLQGVAIGWLRTMTDGGQILGPLVMGALADAVDLSAPFLLGSILLAAAAWRCHRRTPAMSPTAATAGRDS